MFAKSQKWIHSIPPKIRFSIRLFVLVTAVIVLVVVLHALNSHYLAKEQLGSEFVTHWLSIKLFLARGQDPYSAVVKQAVDQYVIDILKWKGEIPADTKFLLPIYGFLIYLPFMFFDSYASAYSWWITLLELCVFFVGYLSFRILKKDVRHDFLIFAMVIIAACFNPFTLRIIQEGNLFPVTLVFILLCVLALKNEADELAGVLLAFSSLQILQFWLPILFIIIWSFRLRRRKLAGWFFGTIFLLGISSALLMPQWFLYFTRGIFQYFTSNPAQFLPDIMAVYYPGTSKRLGILIMVVFALVITVEGYLSNRKQFAPFYWTFALTLVVNMLFIPRYSSALVLSVVTPMAMILMLWKDRWGKKGILIAILITGVFLMYSWFITSLGSLKPEQIVFWEFLPIVAFFVILLYWIRWWLFRNTDLWFDEIYTFESPDRKNFWDVH